jgi:hypothetical protein
MGWSVRRAMLSKLLDYKQKRKAAAIVIQISLSACMLRKKALKRVAAIRQKANIDRVRRIQESKDAIKRHKAAANLQRCYRGI